MSEKKKHILFDTETFNNDKDAPFIFYWHVVEDDNTYHMINPSREDIRAVFAEYLVDPRVYRDNPLSVMELDKYLHEKGLKEQVVLCREATEAFKHYVARVMEVTEDD